MKEKIERKDKPNESYRFVACIDGSVKSLNCLRLCCQIMNPAKDTVIAMTVRTKKVHLDECKNKSEAIFEEFKVEGSNLILDQEGADTVGTTIVCYLMSHSSPETYVDFAAVGN
jgi:hypothetical protein